MILSKIRGPIGRIVLNRPEAHNALDQAAMRELGGLLADWAGRDLRALVLTGRGRSFCAGASLGDVAGQDWSENPLTAACDALEAFPAPTIAALNGGVYGGGVEIALACDFRVGVTGMRAFAPPARLGIHYEPAGVRRAIERLGHRPRGGSSCWRRPSTPRRCWRWASSTTSSRPRTWPPGPTGWPRPRRGWRRWRCGG